MMLSHASAEDIDNWEKIGNKGWNFDTLKPYYEKFETYNAPSEILGKLLGSEIIDPTLHGTSGQVQITFPHGTSEVDGMWRRTLQTLGLGAEKDPRAGATLGGAAVLRYIDKEARRSTAASAFYAPNARRANLSVVTNAHVNKILLEDKKGFVVASGVSFQFEGKDYTVSALREVVLSAGAFQSPQILELSGIGSKAILQQHNIKTVVENPNVGENLQDHTLVPLEFETIEGIATAETIKQPGVFEWALGEWQAGRGGPLGSGVSGTAFLSYASVLSNTTDTKIQTLMQGGIHSKQFALQKVQFESNKEAALQFNFALTWFNPYTSENLHKLFQHDDPGNFLGVAAVITHPFSRGIVHIASSDSKEKLTIDPRYFSHPLDLEILAHGLLSSQTVVETKPLADVAKNSPDLVGKKIQPSFKIDSKLDIERAKEFVKEVAISSWHPIGTCSMSPKADGGVVDERLRIYGVKGLRVVDTSVMPLNVRGNIASAVYAIAERANDLIKEDWGISLSEW
jgi:choline dehydrogenase-like flavoprotein